ncbi:LuxR C-terminal-related transcriptional regulator [Propylenella binzhouense]|uniref:Response regulator transcription factor n=1 Tax=Propylenella binzhouense TaxID=2555902 RepID=A0A964WRX8_9HYPH|nr:response regulator transcription factor [Propylenella binzhouense]
MTEAVTFIVADDHPLFRGALRQTVGAAFPGARIIEAGTLDEVAAAIRDLDEPDLVLFDLSMPGTRGFSGLVYLRAQYPEIPICVVSGSEDPATIRRAIALGASGFIPKSAAPAVVAQAVATLLSGDIWTPHGIALDAEAKVEAEIAARLRTLTPQQARVLMMLSEGLLNKQIAYELGVSEATVKAHVSAVLQKLGVENRTKAVLTAGRFDLGQWQLHAAE